MREKMRQWFPLWKHILAVIVLALFVGLILWNRHNFIGYFPEWLSRRMSSHIWACIVAIALAYWGKWAVASGLTLGWVAGVPIAQTIGDRLYEQILSGTDLSVHVGPKHAYIWWMCIAIGVLLGITVQVGVWLCRKDRKHLSKVNTQDFYSI